MKTTSVTDGQTVNGIIVSNGDYLIVYSGGIVSNTTVNDGGFEVVSAGGTAKTSLVNSGGFEVVSAGGSTKGTFLRGEQDVLSGGIAGATTVGSGGFQIVSFGGQASDTVVDDGGFESVSSGGTAVGSILNKGGELDVSNGGTASSTTINDGGYESVSSGGVTIGTTVKAGGSLDVQDGGTASNTIVSGGGLEYVSGGGTTTGTTVKSGGREIVEGTAVNTVVLSGGSESVAGGTVFRNTVRGTEYVFSGGSSVSATISSGGAAYLSNGGMASNTTVKAGGRENVSSGGTASGNTLSSGGFEYVTLSGIASRTSISNGGVQYISNGGSAVNTVVSSGGAEYVSSGGMTINPTVLNGGAEYLFNGGSIDFTALAFAAGGTAKLNSTTNILTVQEGAASSSLHLGGKYTGAYFHLASDGLTGTLVTMDGTPCYCRGTRILTDHGEVAVEELQIGNHLITLSGRTRPIRWIGRRSYAGRFANGNREVLPIVFHQGSLGAEIPRRDLFVSPLHAMYIGDVLVPASALVNGTSIVQLEAVDQVDYFHLELDSHDVILAEGALSETFVDDANRGMFHNAANYRHLYPDRVPVPANYYAPRVEGGEALEVVRECLPKLAVGNGAYIREAAAPRPGKLRSYVDVVEHERITGWAFDEATPTMPALLEILDNGVPIGRVLANRHRVDVEQAGIGNGRSGFDFVIPESLSPLIRHVIQVRRCADRHELQRSPWLLDAAINVPTTSILAPLAGSACRSELDMATRERIEGWALSEVTPNTPVIVQIADNGILVGEVPANRYRADLLRAGIGDGRHGFEFRIPGGLSPLMRHVVSVRCKGEAVDIDGSPVVIEAANSFDAGLEQAVALAIDGLASADAQARVLSFMVAQTDRLVQQRADDDGQRDERRTYWQSRRRGRLTADGGKDIADPGLRALIVDDRIPLLGRDAGSQAILSHAASLRRLGYAVSLVAADEMASPQQAVTDSGGLSYLGAPFYTSVEDVLRRQAECFDVVYLHRADIAARYLQLARRYNPLARIVYGVADLHHVRMERQAAIEDRPDLLAASKAMRLLECTAAWTADAVLTHSTTEADLLRQVVPGANVHHVPWHVAACPTPVNRDSRFGVAFIGSSHTPNVDAAEWLVEAVLPLVWETEPTITCRLIGSDMPEAVRRLARPGVVAEGHVADLRKGVFDQVRLTVAPLRFGAGVKGKILESLAAGVPCIMSEVAAEGLQLPPDLRELVGQDETSLAALICRLHADKAALAAAASAGLKFIRQGFTTEVVDAALARCIGTNAISTNRSAAIR